jgi:hypothetical protein
LAGYGHYRRNKSVGPLERPAIYMFGLESLRLAQFLFNIHAVVDGY